MENSNPKNDEQAKENLNPLGLEEMNDVIKSFQNSSFNHEQLYKKDEKSFIKKTLYDLAVENENRIDNKNFDKNTKPNLTKKEDTEKFDDVNQVTSIVTENEIKTNLVSENEQEENQFINNTPSKEQQIDSSSQKKMDEILENKIEQTKVTESAQDIKNEEQKNSLKNEKLKEDEKDKSQFEEKTLDALDSVREAVSKSLENNEDLSSKSNSEKENFLNEEIKVWGGKNLNSKDCRFIFKREVIADTGIFLQKKRYVMHILDDEGIPMDKYKYTGVEVVRSTMPDAIKPYVKGVIDNEYVLDIVLGVSIFIIIIHIYNTLVKTG